MWHYSFYKPNGINKSNRETKKTRVMLVNDMKRLCNIFITALIVAFVGSAPLHAEEEGTIVDSVEVHFKQSRIELLPDYGTNKQSMARIADSLRASYSDSMCWKLRSVHIMGAASPEGSVEFNRWLSERRAEAIFSYFTETFKFSAPDSLKTTEFRGRDWGGLLLLVKNDPEVPYKEDVIDLIQQIVDAKGGKVNGKDPLWLLKSLHKSVPYQYLYKNLFPTLRASKVLLTYDRVVNYEYRPVMKTSAALVFLDSIPIYDMAPERKFEYTYRKIKFPKPFYMSLRTNMLYDAGLVPNIGADFYLGKNWSVSGFWTYSWWKSDGPHWYWRTYGGDIAIRKWFGSAAKEKPLTGHHIGLYFQALTYDFEWGGRGYIAGVPGGTMWDKCNLGGGIEYGYSLPIKRRLNLDFTIAVGYLAGECQEYIPDDGCYVWQKTVDRKWFGPTKAEVSLVWLIGYGNYNKKKGGKK